MRTNIRAALAFAFAACAACGGGSTGPTDASTDAPPSPRAPITKLDLLLMVDNSASMGDKQELLRDVVPDLVTQLTVSSGAAPAIADVHVGVVTSSLGGGGATDTCPTTGPNSKNPIAALSAFDRHNDDSGHLINRKRPGIPPSTAMPGVEDPIANAKPSSGDGGNFLAWLPPVPQNEGQPPPNVTPYTEQSALTADFQELVTGAQEFGCGLEAQLESWYRFLAQPDPWDSIQLDGTVTPPRAKLVGVDETLLRQRKDFLREDSLLVVLAITDEPDSWSDPLSVSGRGWATRAAQFPGSPTGLMPRGTSACDAAVDPGSPATTGPNAAACTSCGFAGTDVDPNCQIACGAGCAGYYTQADDGLNVRYTSDMKRRYGLDPQFPIARYVDALTSAKIPDRNGEHKDGMGPYLGDKNCTNPIFARELPASAADELCNLPRGVRTPSSVFFGVIGGVPWQLLTSDPSAASTAPFKDTLDAADWTRIVGKDPATYQYDGIDAHMIETYKSRGGSCPPGAPNGCDPIHGREWDTTTSKMGLDLQYACTFELPLAKNCADPSVEPACDCGRNPKGGYVQSPVCAPNPQDANNPTLQTRGKAYPTIRELRLAKELGAQAVVGSVCPRTLDKMSPDYGYRPVVRNLAARINALREASAASR